MKRAIVFASVCLLATVCFAQMQERYHNSDWHFSFVLPEGWEWKPYDELPQKEKKLIDKVFSEGQKIAICKRPNDAFFSPPFMLIRWSTTEDKPEGLYHKMWTSPSGMKVFIEQKGKNIQHIQDGKGYIPDYWRGAIKESVDYNYDDENHLLTGVIKLKKSDIGDILIASLRWLGSHRVVAVSLYLEGEDTKQYEDTISAIVNSFRFEEGYGFGETKGATSGLVQKFFGNTWQSWLLWAVGIIIVSWLIHRWVSG